MLSLPAGRQGLTLHFDKLSVLSVPKEAALFYPALKDGAWRRRTGQAKKTAKYE
jgi:hypothetical protein